MSSPAHQGWLRPFPAYYAGMDSTPWSNKQLRKLGECIRDERPIPTNLPPYDEVMLHFNDVAADVQERISELDWGPLLGDRPFEVTSRPKTIDTLRQKLQRDHNTPLSNIQDIAGVRLEAEMSLDEQDAVVAAIAGRFDHDLSQCSHDLRAKPVSGYRAVHLWLRLPTRVEVQIRTHLQGKWANMYESLADVIGREIRYGVTPAAPNLREAVSSLQVLSTEHISKLERARNSILHMETASRTAWGVAEKFPDQEQLRLHAMNLDSKLEDLRTTVRDSELGVKTSLEMLKESFDSIRVTRR